MTAISSSSVVPSIYMHLPLMLIPFILPIERPLIQMISTPYAFRETAPVRPILLMLRHLMSSHVCLSGKRLGAFSGAAGNPIFRWTCGGGTAAAES